MSAPPTSRGIPLHRIAGAPISWGVCEVPGWGHQLAPSRVLEEMGALGLPATEAGPDGYLPSDAGELRTLLGQYGLGLVGGFVPTELHRDAAWLAPVQASARRFAQAGGSVLVLAAATGAEGYETVPELDDAGWRRLLANADRAAAVAHEHGLVAALHPHLGTYVETGTDVVRVLDGSSVALCVDTGHLLAAGADPVEVCRRDPDRVAHVHLKDVDAHLAGEVAAGRSYHDAVRAGLYRPLGAGDVDVEGLVRILEAYGYGGWYVLEQDVVLDQEPPSDGGPVGQVRASMQALRSIALGVDAHTDVGAGHESTREQTKG